METDIAGFWQPRVDDPSDARALAAAAVRVTIAGGLYVLFKYNLTFDSNPPAGVEKADQAVRGGLGHSF